MNRTCKRKQGDPISVESLEEIRHLADMPDELINTDDIPERPFEQGKQVQFPLARKRTTDAQRKAS